MNVLSLFDGMSCGMIALDRLGIKVDNYYASEIDKYAMQVSAANYPEIIQVGDITKLDLSTLPKIDLVMGGSPCQGFSFAGKQLAFDDPRSALFFEFVKCVEALKPKYFLLENVRMKKEYLDIISEYMGVEPIFIQSSLVSAQSRQRYYWTNIPNVTPPEERGIVLRDILEDYPNENPVKHTERNARHLKQLDEKSLCMTATMYKGAGNNGMTLVPQHKEQDHLKQFKIKDETVPKYVPNEEGDFCDPYNKKMIKGDKSTTLRTNSSNGNTWVKQIDKMTTKDGKAYCVTANYDAARPKNSMDRKQRTMIPLEDGQELPSGTEYIYDETNKSHKPQHIGTAVDINGHDILKRVYSPNGKSPTINTMGGGNREPKVVVDVRAMTEVRTPEANKIRQEHRKKTGKDWSPRNMRHLVERKDEKMNTLTTALTKQHILQITRDKDQEVYWRKLTPLECERLQTVPDNYTNHVSNTQRYKMLGNGWTIEVIAHIFKNMESV